MTSPSTETLPAAKRRPLWVAMLKAARVKQWSKSAFVLVGPAYGLADLAAEGRQVGEVVWAALLAALAFALASSACYIFNDLADREADRHHPRKCRRPIAAGEISPGFAAGYGAALLIGAVLVVLLLPSAAGQLWLGIAIGLHVVNVFSYTLLWKHIAIADVMSLALGFVLRVMGGCAAVGIEPSVWLLNVTFFLSMFLAFGKRLGERRTLAGASVSGGTLAEEHRRVQGSYTDAMLQMSVVISAVLTLVVYAFYVQAKEPAYVVGFNLLWLTILPATYGLLRCILVLEHGLFDDPTELAYRDRSFQTAGILFVLITVLVMMLVRPVELGSPQLLEPTGPPTPGISAPAYE